jgi:hypothetical protein
MSPLKKRIYCGGMLVKVWLGLLIFLRSRDSSATVEGICSCL